ncbi:MAG TPA: hypothetical protein VEK79_19360 [Thermoanaerobaculia bacterium]|nr:hypothetical protein [Thermoanaerobaculia bacterium]
MQPATTTPPAKTAPPAKSRSAFRTIIWTALLLALAFGVGFVPKELERRRLVATLEAKDLDLRLANLHRQLGVASHEAQRNNFSSAATAARVFFEGCRTVVNEYPFENQPRTKLALQAYASSSDTILGELANADPVVKERLASLYLTMDGVLERRQ